MVPATQGGSRWCFTHNDREQSQDRKLKEEFVINNGARLLEKSIASFNDGAKPIRIFSAKELEEATDHYARDRILVTNFYYTCYRGVFEDRTIIVKKGHGSEVLMEAFMQEAVILSHVNHKNVAKLLGCCIETKILILVCEFLSGGALSDHIYERDPRSQISWENRLRIATEISYALAYLHIGTPRPIVVRHIKPEIILLDENYTAKIADFGLSVLIPSGETYVVTTEVIGTLGYFEPQYIHTKQVTEKSDVFSFGVILIELLTGMKCTTLIDAGFKSKSNYLISLTACAENANQLIALERDDVVSKACILEEENANQLIACVELALRCIKYIREERPTMKEVVEELRRIKRHVLSS